MDIDHRVLKLFEAALSQWYPIISPRLHYHPIDFNQTAKCLGHHCFIYGPTSYLQRIR